MTTYSSDGTIRYVFINGTGIVMLVYSWNPITGEIKIEQAA